MFSRFEVGKVYSQHDDAIYKVIYINDNNDFMIVIHYSFNHNVYNVEVLREDDKWWIDKLELVSESESGYIFESIPADRI